MEAGWPASQMATSAMPMAAASVIMWTASANNAKLWAISPAATSTTMKKAVNDSATASLRFPADRVALIDSPALCEWFIAFAWGGLLGSQRLTGWVSAKPSRPMPYPDPIFYLSA